MKVSITVTKTYDLEVDDEDVVAALEDEEQQDEAVIELLEGNSDCTVDINIEFHEED